METWAHILDHNPRRLSRLSTEPADSRLHNFWVHESYGFYFNIPSYFRCFITISTQKTFYSFLFQANETFKKFMSRILCNTKWKTSIFCNLESSSRPLFDLFYIVWKVFLSVFLSNWKSQRPWKGFGVISKHLFYASDSRMLKLCEACPLHGKTNFRRIQHRISSWMDHLSSR